MRDEMRRNRSAVLPKMASGIRVMGKGIVTVTPTSSSTAYGIKIKRGTILDE